MLATKPTAALTGVVCVAVVVADAVWLEVASLEVWTVTAGVTTVSATSCDELTAVSVGADIADAGGLSLLCAVAVAFAAASDLPPVVAACAVLWVLGSEIDAAALTGGWGVVIDPVEPLAVVDDCVESTRTSLRCRVFDESDVVSATWEKRLPFDAATPVTESETLRLGVAEPAGSVPEPDEDPGGAA
jgi:hypothetical protein